VCLSSSKTTRHEDKKTLVFKEDETKPSHVLIDRVSRCLKTLGREESITRAFKPPVKTVYEAF
jgi:hypothetical protein